MAKSLSQILAEMPAERRDMIMARAAELEALEDLRQAKARKSKPSNTSVNYWPSGLQDLSIGSP